MSYISTFSAAATGLTVSTASFTVPASATYCVFMVLMRGSDGAETTLSAATLGAQAVTRNTGVLRQFNGYQAVEAGYILAADMPSGSVTASATRTSTPSGGGIVISVSFFDDAAQAIPKVALNGYDSAPPDPVTTSVTTVGDAVLVDAIGTAQDTAVYTEQEASQTEVSDNTGYGGDASLFSSVRAVTGAASHAMSWDTAANSARTTHVVLAIESGTPIAEPDPEQATTGNIPLTPAAGWTSYGLVDPVFTNTSALKDYTGDAAVTGDTLEVGPITGLGAGMSVTFLPDGRYNIEDPNDTWVDDITFPRRVIRADGVIGTTQVMTIDADVANNAATGIPTITGTAREGSTLTAVTTGIADLDGIASFSYQWYRGVAVISGATSSTYTIANGDIGSTIHVDVSLVDNNGTAEGPLSSANTSVVEALDIEAPVITLTGDATVNLVVGQAYTEDGATYTDNIDDSGAATVGGDTVDVNTAATYTVTYDFTDTAGNAATQVTRTVIVSAADVVPTQFDLGADVTNAERSTATQRTFVIAGIDSGQTVSITATGSASVSPATGELGDTVTVTLVSSGSYSATLSGGATINGISDSFSITTRAQIVPTVSTQPTAQSVTEGQTATFTAAFTNAASIQWYDASDDSAVSGATGTSLAVNTVLADDGNTYYAIATSSDAATVQTNTVALSVAASTATQAPVINTGGSTSITLTVGDTYSDPSWTWSDDVVSGQAVTWSGSVDTATAGSYTRTATATNAIDTTTQDYAVTVQAAPSVTLGTVLTLEVAPSREVMKNAEGIKIYRAVEQIVADGATDENGAIIVPLAGNIGDTERLFVQTDNGEVKAAVTVEIEDISDA